MIYLILSACLISFIYLVFKQWQKDNNIMTLHIEKDFNIKLQEILLKDKR